MSGLGDTLAKPLGPMPLGAWLALGAGGLFLAWQRSDDEPDVTKEVQQVPVPVGAIASPDGAPAIVNVVVQVPEKLGQTGTGTTAPDDGETTAPTVTPAADPVPVALPYLPDIPAPELRPDPSIVPSYTYGAHGEAYVSNPANPAKVPATVLQLAGITTGSNAAVDTMAGAVLGSAGYSMTKAEPREYASGGRTYNAQQVTALYVQRYGRAIT